jgi:hypothetical protein
MNIILFIKTFCITKILISKNQLRMNKIIENIENENKIITKKQNANKYLEDNKFLLLYLSIADY